MISLLNHTPAQELTLFSFRNGQTLKPVENLPKEMKTTTTGFTPNDSPLPVDNVRTQLNSKTPDAYLRQRRGCLPKNTSLSLQEHLKRARAALDELFARESRLIDNDAYSKAIAWLAENREKYAGEWIALRGAELLANGTIAGDVYARVRGLEPPAFVVKVERENLPFAGW